MQRPKTSELNQLQIDLRQLEVFRKLGTFEDGRHGTGTTKTGLEYKLYIVIVATSQSVSCFNPSDNVTSL